MRWLRWTVLVLTCLGLAEVTSWHIESRLRDGLTRWAPRASRRAVYPWRAGQPPPPPPPVQARSGRDLAKASRPVTDPDPPLPPEVLAPQENRRPAPVASERRRTGPEPAAQEPLPQAPPGTRILPRSRLQELFLNQDGWVERATFRRARQGDRVLGIHVEFRGPDHPLAELGLQPGDILTDLNGLPLRSPEEYRQAGHSLRQDGVFAVGVLRKGQPLRLDFQVVDPGAPGSTRDQRSINAD